MLGFRRKKTLERFEPGSDHYVTAVRPSDHRALLAEAAEQLSEISLSTQAVAWRARRRIAGQQRDTVVVFSQRLYEGQLSGLHTG
jgi:hypothetical protein